MSRKQKNNPKKQRTSVSITSKEDGTPPLEWMLDFTPKNVSSKIELHQKAIGEKPKDDENRVTEDPKDVKEKVAEEPTKEVLIAE